MRVSQAAMGKSKRTRSRPTQEIPQHRLTVGQVLLAHAVAFALITLACVWFLFGSQTLYRRGVVAAIDAASRTLILHIEPSGNPVSFVWTEGTKFLHHDTPIRPDSLVVGGQVVVVYRRLGLPFTATKVTMLSPPANPRRWQ
jgi:hypothetical protein